MLLCWMIRAKMREHIQELEMELTDSLPAFSCVLCARCCRGKIVALYGRDLERLSGLGDCHVTTSPEERSLTGARRKMRMENGACVFLGEGRCLHYERRPDTCRRHPFLVSGRNKLVASTCPGVDWSNQGKEGNHHALSEGIAPGIDRYLANRKGRGSTKP